MPTFFINSDSFKASNAFVATLGAAPGSTYLGQIIAAGLPTAANAMLAAMAATTAATRADAIAANLGLTGTAATTASTYLQTVAFAGAASTHGQGLLTALDLFTTLQNDATFGTAASAYVARVNTALSYSSVAANNSTDLTTLAAAVGSAGSSGAGSTFTLTTGTDTWTGTGNSDTVSGFFGTAGDSLGAGDTIDGAAGTGDVLNLTTTGGAASSVATTVRNIETINIRGLVTSTFDATSVTGANAINVIDSIAGTTATVQNLSSLATVVGATGRGAVTVTHALANVSGTTDKALLSVTGAGAANTAAAGAASNAVTAALTASTSGIETVSVATSGTNIFSVTGSTTAATDHTTVEITGNGSNTITASAMTQASLYDMSTSTGTNTLNLAGALTTSDTVKGGTGADTLRTTNATTVANLTVTGVETLRLNTGSTTGTFVFASAPNFATVQVDGDTAESGTQTLTGLGNSLATVRYVGDALSANAASAQQFNNLTVNNSLTGTETVAVTVANGGITSSGGYTLRTLTLNGAENITVTTSDISAAAAATFTGISSTALSTLTVTAAAGGVALGTVSAAPATGAGNLVSLNLSAITGTAASSATIADNSIGAGTVILGATGTGGTTITIGGAEAGTDTITYTGGAGVDNFNAGTNNFAGTVVLSGLGGADVIAGGNGGDTLTGGEGADFIAGSIGADSIILTETVAAVDTVVFGNETTATGGTDVLFGALGGADTITGFGSNDVLTFDISAFGLTDGVEYVGAIGGVGTTDHIIVITGGAGYATDALAEAAWDAQVNDTDDAIIIYFNTTSNLAHIIHDTTANTTGTPTLVGTFAVTGNVVGGMANLTTANIDSFA